MVKVITKVGNGAAIRLDKAILELLHLRIGDEVVVTVRDGQLVVTSANVGFDDQTLDRAADEMFTRYKKTFRKLAE
jgi:antitoxin component of MazEF toxin-antitoxin module